MTIWVDAQLSPAIAFWIEENFDVQAVALRNLGLRDAEDIEIFNEAKRANVVVITKDSDFSLASRTARFAAENYLADLWQYFKCEFKNYIVKNFARCHRFIGKRRKDC